MLITSTLGFESSCSVAMLRISNCCYQSMIDSADVPEYSNLLSEIFLIYIEFLSNRLTWGNLDQHYEIVADVRTRVAQALPSRDMEGGMAVLSYET